MTAKKKRAKSAAAKSPGRAANLTTLQERIREFAATPRDEIAPRGARDAVMQLLDALESGAVRAAVDDGDGQWHAVDWVKLGILLAFRVGVAKKIAVAGQPVSVAAAIHLSRSS